MRSLTTFSRRRTWACLAPLVLLGFFLRIIRLGANNYDFDEFGVLSVVNVSSPLEALRNTHNHVMGMPLDYLISWLCAHFSSAEAVMRLPAVLWGTMTLIPAFFLFRRLSGLKTAWIAVLLLALAPFHVQYSQELRFYASLGFFYLTSTWLYLWAIEKPVLSRWAIYTLVTIVGIFFHIYVFLALVNAGCWFWFSRKSLPLRSKLYFTRSSIAILVTFLVALLNFGVVNAAPMPFLMGGYQSVPQVLGIGIGLLPFYPATGPFALLFGLAISLLALIGFLPGLKTGPDRASFALLLSSAAQILLIIGLDLLKNYPFFPRQLIMLNPFVLFFAARGVGVLDAYLHRFLTRQGLRPSNLISYGLVVLLVMVSLPALFNYYQGDKGRLREINQDLRTRWQPGDRIIAFPSYNAYLVRYYLEQNGSPDELVASLVSADYAEVGKLAEWPGRQFLIFPPYPEDIALLRQSVHLEPLFTPTRPHYYSQALWVVKR